MSNAKVADLAGPVGVQEPERGGVGREALAAEVLRGPLVGVRGRRRVVVVTDHEVEVAARQGDLDRYVQYAVCRLHPGRYSLRW